ncbi:MAG: hypothetical protein VYA34_09205 [Myxococcota bacterium]|nr:hypothetical protein [Myxococcota bacterium]
MITWTHWPAKRKPARAALGALIIASAVAAFSSMGWIYAIISAFILLTATTEALFPTRFRLTPEGVEAFNIFRHARRPWERFEHWQSTHDGYFLSGRGAIPFIARRRNVWIRCPERKAEVGAFLASHLQEVK